MKAFPFLSTAFFLAFLAIIAGSKSRYYPNPDASEIAVATQEGTAQAVVSQPWLTGLMWERASNVLLVLCFICFLGWVLQRARTRQARFIAQAEKRAAMPRGQIRHPRKR
ncbi:hypothetical protein EI77_04525 [Prosthecobacter fusiformis]|uniref:Uncharacterized protein n=1 Tax=Prosthecobacter fusiformis TaxID=48464 RepID=A0A4R7RKE3_9BACT|nr:hypothetical protein [Prosthecobacter fusiformis]TDU63103.1 hypothetical protein EI77_04525 [Prosthecobacter fusiformis]